MQITEIEYTPNPNAVKFMLAEQIFPTVGGRTQSYESLEEAEEVPLARDILEIEHVETVFFAANYITVNQDGDAEWRELMREVAEPIRAAEVDDARAGEAAAEDEVESGGESDEEIPGADDPRMEEIEEILDEEIRPYLQGDGGDLRIRGLVDDELRIDYQGACGSCPASITGT
ncbi:MAG: NifU N-terminal domain-containing protein, partial [Bradymonadaceae bacterium]